MKRTLKTLFSHAGAVALTLAAVAAPGVYPLVVVLAAYALVSITVVAITCSVAAVIAWTWLGTKRIATGWKIDERLEADTAQFARDTLGSETVVPGAPTAADSHDWSVAYQRFALVAYSTGSMSYGTMRPYIERNKQATWTWMKDQLLQAGWAEEQGGRTRFVGLYKRFGLELRCGRLVLLPHPRLPAPVINPWIRDANMANMTNTPNTPNTQRMVIIENA